MTEPLWRQMIEASDAVLTSPGELYDPDAAVAEAHLKVVRQFLRLESYDPLTWALLTREITKARRAAQIAADDEGGPQAPRIAHHRSATVAAPGGEAEAPPATPTDFSP